MAYLYAETVVPYVFCVALEEICRNPIKFREKASVPAFFQTGFFVAMPHGGLYNAHAIRRPAWKNHTTCATRRRPIPMEVAFLVPEA